MALMLCTHTAQSPPPSIRSDFAPKNDTDPRALQIALLFTACEEGDAERIHIVLNACIKESYELDEIVNARTPDGASPLFYAAKGGSVPAMEALIKTGRCVINLFTSGGFTPLWMAALRGKADAVTLLLHQYGIQVDQPANDGRCAHIIIFATTN